MHITNIALILSAVATSFARPFGQFEFDPLTGAVAFTGVDAAVDPFGNSFVGVQQDTSLVGQRLVGLTQNSASGNQGGPAFEANGAVIAGPM
ncbi:hypothetical protein FBU59_000034 [Linderina macrospora]|uniref:Uncharacterized protein n=1 Tax=Linderina macrospora TaxID=4868 RepID=A0ACC1JHR3_9FUNG|nr:hypothetical protein FBU59_000034 [Linderina macrospora]